MHRAAEPAMREGGERGRAGRSACGPSRASLRHGFAFALGLIGQAAQRGGGKRALAGGLRLALGKGRNLHTRCQLADRLAGDALTKGSACKGEGGGGGFAARRGAGCPFPPAPPHRSFCVVLQPLSSRTGLRRDPAGRLTAVPVRGKGKRALAGGLRLALGTGRGVPPLARLGRAFGTATPSP